MTGVLGLWDKVPEIWVLRQAKAAWLLAPPADPPLKPSHPTHKRAAPSTEMRMLCGGNACLPTHARVLRVWFWVFGIRVRPSGYAQIGIFFRGHVCVYVCACVCVRVREGGCMHKRRRMYDEMHDENARQGWIAQHAGMYLYASI